MRSWSRCRQTRARSLRRRPNRGASGRGRSTSSARGPRRGVRPRGARAKTHSRRRSDVSRQDGASIRARSRRRCASFRGGFSTSGRSCGPTGCSSWPFATATTERRRPGDFAGLAWHFPVAHGGERRSRLRHSRGRNESGLAFDGSLVREPGRVTLPCTVRRAGRAGARLRRRSRRRLQRPSPCLGAPATTRGAPVPDPARRRGNWCGCSRDDSRGACRRRRAEPGRRGSSGATRRAARRETAQRADAAEQETGRVLASATLRRMSDEHDRALTAEV